MNTPLSKDRRMPGPRHPPPPSLISSHSHRPAQVMEPLKLKLAALVLAALGTPATGWAHDQSGTLGKPAAATDFYVVLCSNDGSGPPSSVSVQLAAGGPATAPLVSVQVQLPDQAIAKSATDPVNGDAGASDPIQIAAGNALYYVTIGKAGPGKVAYSLAYHCLTAGNEHTGTDLSSLQDQ